LKIVSKNSQFECFQEKWIPVFRPEARYSKKSSFSFKAILVGAFIAFGSLPSNSQGLTDPTPSPGTGPKHAIAMHGAPALGPTFRKLPFAHDGALKGGSVTLSPEAYGDDVIFDSLNPFIVKGSAYWGIRHLVFESLMTRNPDEPFSLYGMLAQTIETPEDRTWVEFVLRPGAKFSDGSPVTPEDVLFSMETLREKGLPNFRRYYGMIETAEITGPNSIRFNFSEEADRETPLLVSLMPILSKAYYTDHEFNKTTLEPPIGSGPYRISGVDPGRSVTFSLNPNYWGQRLPVNVGRNNFEQIKLESFRDNNSKFEAFKKGLFTMRFEGDPDRWTNSYDISATRNALILMDEFKHDRPSGMLGLAFNTRKPLFTDKRVRQALTLPFDFEWMNENFFHGAFTRSQSYFDNSELAAKGPASFAERELLALWAQDLDPSLINQGWTAPVNGDRANARANALKAMALLKEAGWAVKDGALTYSATGQTFEFEILLPNRTHERIALVYAKSLKRLGITANVRVVDSAQYQQRLQTFDYDMVPFRWAGSLSPGNEQAYRWGSEAANQEGSYNIAGVQSPAIDGVIQALVEARTRNELITAARALDRLLLSGYYAVPLYHQTVDRMAWWGELRHPSQTPLLGWGYGGAGFRLSTWWMSADN
jgi:peptide/nickel transport system substrate-binding protein